MYIKKKKAERLEMEISFIGRKMYIDLRNDENLAKAKKNLEYNYDYQVLNILYNDIEKVKDFLKLINDTTLINLYTTRLINGELVKKCSEFKSKKILSYVDITTYDIDNNLINITTSYFDGVRLRPEILSLNKENSSNFVKLLNRKSNLLIKPYYNYQDLNTLNLENLYDFYKNIFVFERNNNIDLMIGLEVLRVFEGEYELSADTKYKKLDIDKNLTVIRDDINYEEKDEKVINRNFNTIDTLYYPFTSNFVKYVSNFMNLNIDNSN